MPRVLIADDEKTVRNLLIRVLALVGISDHEIAEAADGFQAELELQERTFELMITDNDMPHATGREVIEWARGENRLPPTILISGGICEEDRDHLARSLGVTVIRKPFKIAEMIAVINGRLGLGEVSANDLGNNA